MSFLDRIASIGWGMASVLRDRVAELKGAG